MTSPAGLPADLRDALAGRYNLERELGQGGMATVYLARDVRHDRPVAIKVLESERSILLGAERFDREIKVLARLRHPFVLPLHDSGEAAGALYFVMPYVDGESLRARFTRESTLPVDDVVAIARQIADALDYAHDEGVIHRDVKPENILLSRHGHAMLADFGIARGALLASGAPATSPGLTLSGTAIGTADYMSPEQALGETDIDGRSDVYSLGCVVYEALAGHAPFSGPNTRRCLLHDRPCGAVSCAAHTRWAPVARDVQAFFGTTTVADLTGRAEGVPGSSPHPHHYLHHSAAGGETL